MRDSGGNEKDLGGQARLLARFPLYFLLPPHHLPRLIWAFLAGKKLGVVFSPATADETSHA